MGAAMTWLTPQFEKVPSELVGLPRWVIWKGNKKPYDPVVLGRPASINDPATWGGFEQARSAVKLGGWCGLGFVLNGDGLVGIDIDKCVVNGKPDGRAIELLETLNAPYIEFSPSGQGLRAFGYAPPLKKGRRGVVNSQSVELYSNHRYLTLTGHALKSQPLCDLTGFEQLAQEIREATEDTQVTESNSSVPSVSSVGIVKEWPVQAIPTKIGQRNKKLFELARWLKGREPEASLERQKQVVENWLRAYDPVIGSKDVGVSWADFRNAWDKVICPYGTVLRESLLVLPTLPFVPELDKYGFKARHLLQICAALQTHHRNEPFFLGSRTAGELIDLHFTDAAALLRAFVREEWIVLIEKGAGLRASRYRFNILNCHATDVVD
jgi:hypothetical protein